jgi:polysaccharide deacetylase family protein (PEP-CTERM system associated)
MLQLGNGGRLAATERRTFSMKIAVLSLDIEDWYHLDYFRESACDRSRSLLDGVDVYREILARYDIRSSCFVVGELVSQLRGLLADMQGEGHELGVHGWDHKRPLMMTPEQFDADLRKSKDALENAIGASASGYRAPCFSLDRQRLDLIQAAGFGYDSSRILVRGHPLYGSLDLANFDTAAPYVFRHRDFFEFQISTLEMLGKSIPVSGGGYLRIFPWLLMRWLTQRYLREGQLYVLYIHPFELSARPSPPLPGGVPWRSRVRFRLGRKTVAAKLAALIELLQANGYRFTTFAALRGELLAQRPEVPEP